LLRRHVYTLCRKFGGLLATLLAQVQNRLQCSRSGALDEDNPYDDLIDRLCRAVVDIDWRSIVERGVQLRIAVFGMLCFRDGLCRSCPRRDEPGMGKMAVRPVLSFLGQSGISLSGDLHKGHDHGQDSADRRHPGRDITPLNIPCMSKHGSSLPVPVSHCDLPLVIVACGTVVIY
jgi:hypothetical protein